MTTPVESSATPSPVPPPVLDANERRILGVLVEKSKTTPDAYPMSINALVTGSNQKSNRDPLMTMSDADVEDTLIRLQQKGLAIKLTGGRVIRWRLNLYEAWAVSKVELAILAELMLRGPQTEGELRSRVERMEPVDTLDTLRELLKPLAVRRLVVYLTPQGRRGTVLTHGFHAPDELERLRARYHGQATDDDETPRPSPVRPAVASANLEPRLAQALAEIATLKDNVTSLRVEVARLTQELQALKTALGQ
jgi:uncharacterized protein YceH (UPF0502 family)